MLRESPDVMHWVVFWATPALKYVEDASADARSKDPTCVKSAM